MQYVIILLHFSLISLMDDVGSCLFTGELGIEIKLNNCKFKMFIISLKHLGKIKQVNAHIFPN